MVFVATSTIIDFINALIATASTPSIRDFIVELHSRFYQHIDISFMDEFLELSSQENENQFVVHHEMLIKYGVATSNRSSAIKDRLESLGLVEAEDYLLQDILQQKKQGSGGSNKKIYYLTPEAFFLSLQRAKRRADQEVDPVIYAQYFQFLQKVVRYYSEFQAKAEAHRNMMLTKENKSLIETIKAQSGEIVELKAMSREIITINKDTNAQLNNIKYELKTVNEKFDMLFDFVVEFAKMVLPAWIGSSVMKTQFKVLLKDRSITYAMKHLKLMFIVGFYSEQTLIVYFCCRNFAEVPIRLRELYTRHADLTMLKPQAVCLLSCEINLELKIVENMNILPADFNTDYNRRRKSYEIVIPDGSNAESMFDKIVYNARNENFQGYQARRDELLQDEEYDINPQIMDRVKSVDKQFFSSSLPFCQEYIECYIADVDGIVSYRKSSKKASVRPDLGDVSTTDNMYAMLRLKNFVEADTSEQTVDDMVREGVVTKKDISVLKKIAEVENVDISNVQIPDNLSDDDSMPPLLTDDEDDGYDEDDS
jgi:hypothetical protein